MTQASVTGSRGIAKRPVLAVDTHAHIIDPARFPYSPDAAYHPPAGETGPLERYLAVLDAHGISHAVAVQPTSGYLFDHRCLLDAIARSGGRLRGVARIPAGRARDFASVLDVPGIAGVRLDLLGDGVDVLDAPDLPWLLDAMAERAMHVQVQCEGDQLVRALPVIAGMRMPLVIDHCGRPVPSRGLAQPGFAALLELARDGHYVKLTGPFRYSEQGAPFRDCDPYVHALLRAFTPARCLWGSDWPYLRMAQRIDYAGELAMLARWVPDEADRQRILAGTPAQLFGL
jgi:predicted TIM-barrel fold metal-dependent hydrolase